MTSGIKDDHGAVNTTNGTLIQPRIIAREEEEDKTKRRYSSLSKHPVEPHSSSHFTKLDVKGMNRFPTFIEERGGAKPAG